MQQTVVARHTCHEWWFQGILLFHPSLDSLNLEISSLETVVNHHAPRGFQPSHQQFLGCLELENHMVESFRTMVDSVWGFNHPHFPKFHPQGFISYEKNGEKLLQLERGEACYFQPDIVVKLTSLKLNGLQSSAQPWFRRLILTHSGRQSY